MQFAPFSYLQQQVTSFTPTPAPLTATGSMFLTASQVTYPSASALTLTPIYTVECWFRYPVAPTVANQNIFSKWNDTVVGTEYMFQAISSTQLRWITNPNGSAVSINFNTPSANTWHHFAAVGSGSIIAAYIDGTLQGTNNSGGSIPASAAPLEFGARNSNSASTRMTVFISNFRIVKNVALYSGSFTPSTLPLPVTQSANTYGSASLAITSSNGVTGTTMLLNTVYGSLYLKDSSPNNATGSTLGAPNSSSLSPF